MASMLDKLQGEYVKPSDISRKIEVIGSGFGRTGTMSLSATLEKLLCGPIFHGGTIIMQDETVMKTWINIMQPSATREFIQASIKPVLADYVAITDTWGAVMTPELLELYPDANVICTVRDPESWFKSWRALAGRSDRMNGLNKSRAFLKILFWPVPILWLFPYAIESLFKRLSTHYGIESSGPPENEAYLQHHTEWLKRVVPPSRLYFINVKDGWEPLCKILNLPVPSEPFPRVNEAEAMNDLKRWMIRTVLLRWGLILSPGLAALISVVWFAAR